MTDESKVSVQGDKVWATHVDNHGHINKRMEGYEGREIYIVLIPKSSKKGS